MLVLSRKKDESIIIADGVRVTIVEVRGDKVRVGIEAPLSTRVDRQEIWEKIAGREWVRAEGGAQ